MTPPKATPDRKGKVCKPKIDDITATIEDISKAYDEIIAELQKEKDTFISYYAYKLLLDESKTTEED